MNHFQHQTQPTGNTCVLTCIAMVLGKPAQELINKYHELFFKQQIISVREILINEGVRFSTEYTGGYSHLSPSNVYLLNTPSLNIPGMFHYLLLDYRDGYNIKLFDPAKGRNNCKHYVLTPEEADEDETGKSVQLMSWLIDITILGVTYDRDCMGRDDISNRYAI